MDTCEVSALCDMLLDEITFGQRIILLFVMKPHVRIRTYLQCFGNGNLRNSPHQEHGQNGRVFQG